MSGLKTLLKTLRLTDRVDEVENAKEQVFNAGQPGGWDEQAKREAGFR